MMTQNQLPTPYYIVYENRMRRNLELISRVEREAGVNIIMAFKANALWRSFPIVREYNRDFTASSLNELRLGNEELGGEAHVYCPVYTEATIGEFLLRASHLTFNSLNQWERYGARTLEAGVSPGLRVNPQCSVIDTEIYNPALPGSRFGVTAEQLGGELPEGIEGLHFHALCESSSYDLEKVLAAFEGQFGRYFKQLKWVNFGGGHLMTREGYDVDHLIGLLRDFRSRYPWLKVVMEPGSAWMWRTGDLITEVLDVVDNQGIKTAIIDASFACHMPDCLEMPYKPAISESVDEAEGLPRYRLGGNSCLSGDYVGDWWFKEPLKAGDRLTLEDMNHYTTVKTTMFNGIQHPAMVLCDTNGKCTYLRRFDYEDYKHRMS
ncbi:MAG: carboxynorspermidine decarboxylase [Duncaniella sp.]|uniref:carboxynorspermidine decarboxylase n=1 Tax=Duncaniella sp. TaxID=2518496 RepID=UPI0023CF6B39|nr:carboxynorspermidine decarboxylase [Duncaniella sp.]MDE6089954.1 carboxynorspermidine decarboxylase [Duncaniella sp.]